MPDPYPIVIGTIWPLASPMNVVCERQQAAMVGSFEQPDAR